MGCCDINWPELKKEYLKWRDRLWKETQRILTSSGKVELSGYNRLGYFHKVCHLNEFEKMQREWGQLRRMPQEWISKGNYPGVWTAMFDPFNTFSFAIPPILIMRFYFNQGYFVFNARNPLHEMLFGEWLKKNEAIEENPWKNLINYRGASLEGRMKLHGYPPFKKFFEDYNFGALIGYSDYMAVVIVLENSIQEVELLTIK